MADHRDTKDNTPKLEDVLVERLRAWVREAAPKVAKGEWHAHASITFELFEGDTCYLDDDTPCLSARVTETSNSDDLEGWLDSTIDDVEASHE